MTILFIASVAIMVAVIRRYILLLRKAEKEVASLKDDAAQERKNRLSTESTSSLEGIVPVSCGGLSYCIRAGSGPTCVPLSRVDCMGCPEFKERNELYRSNTVKFERFVNENR